MQSIESSVVHDNDENMEGKQQKPKTLPCKYCSKRFRRVEHVQRHERTHTKEKPFTCNWTHCGKSFGRRDLLVRHEKLVHLNESNKDSGRPRKPSLASVSQHISPDNHVVDTDTAMAMPRTHQHHYHPEPMVSVATLAPDPRARSAACNLDLLSDAATQLAANQVPMMADMGQPPGAMSRIKAYEQDAMSYGERPREQEVSVYPGQVDDYNLFLDEFGSSGSHFLPQAFEDQNNLNIWPRAAGPSKPPSQFPSRFPSLQPDLRDPAHDDSMRNAPPLRVTATDHTVIKNRLDEFSSVLPSDFVFPSRHTLVRFLEGYVTGFHDTLPILHLPTISTADLSPELLLAILAVGAQYRFESHRSNALWYAAKAVALEQVRRRNSHDLTGLLPTPAAYSPHSTRPSPSHGFRHSFSSLQERPMTQDTHREPYSPNTPQSRMETIQSLLLLFAVGIWGAKAILHEALSLQSLLALLVREEGFMTESTQTADWESWIRIESANRTKFSAYCFFNLCSVAYNVPPQLLTSELNPVFLPHSSKLWRAETAWAWAEACRAFPSIDISLQDALSRLFTRSPQGPQAGLSSLGNYILIHSLLQHIFLLKQTCPSFDSSRGLRPDDLEDVDRALRMWQMSFEAHQARITDNSQQGSDVFPGGQVQYNSTALWRLASMYTDSTPSGNLETRDSGQIAVGFNDASFLIRSARLNRAVIQAIHALSMLVRQGVNYVARRKSTERSMQDLFCNLECAILLSKWLMTLSSIGPNDPPASPDERNLLGMLRRMLDETEFAVPIDPSLSGGGIPGHPSNMEMAVNDSTKLRQLAAAVIRLWAETFKGSHIFDIVIVIGNGLEGYADLLERPRDRTPLGRMRNSGLG
ncbi:uncharacterized protein BCR38DRAFT_346884 [Pseudomassariella vexata]|uniref:C2H2-type domain-containing protein n=1 Tax=Pseudomassariella vexata TaxID=1141098 RepID=A0A1Y2DVJ1_9PEZI|nr:uncharacterized protein BCR38DRAFT_346884 [Pseudomassariella vexata]ORY62665.1 hypothetical protein BCR38DRAFT_346884 [Pseudomassariella vexata]